MNRKGGQQYGKQYYANRNKGEERQPQRESCGQKLHQQMTGGQPGKTLKKYEQKTRWQPYTTGQQKLGVKINRNVPPIWWNSTARDFSFRMYHIALAIRFHKHCAMVDVEAECPLRGPETITNWESIRLTGAVSSRYTLMALTTSKQCRAKFLKMPRSRAEGWEDNAFVVVECRDHL